MKKTFLILASLLIILSACTKEIPERDRKPSVTAETTAVKTTILSMADNYNKGNIEGVVELFTDDYIGSYPQDDDVIGTDKMANDLSNYMKQYPGGVWKIDINEIGVSGDQAFARVTSTFSMPKDNNGGVAPIYSEKSLKILKRVKDNTWLIYRSMSFPAYTYSPTTIK